MSRRADKPVRVAVVDDSTFIRKAITRMLENHSRIRLVGSAGSGEELLTHLERWQPDVVTLDLDMPGMGGLATLDRVMAQRPTPVIILSTHSGEGAPLTIEALHRGATDFIDKQRYSLVDFEALRSVLLEKIFQVTGVALEESAKSVDEPEEAVPAAAEPAEREEPIPSAYDLIVIGASTGGPPTVQKILEVMGDEVPAPVVVVQHMPLGFTQAFAERLNAYLPLRVREIVISERLLPHTVYIAAAGKHVKIRRYESELHADLSSEPRGATHVPSVDVLFESAARAVGRRTVGVLLTGMGRDGAQGLLELKASGAYTLAQNEESSIVFGMPRAALSLNAVTEVGDPEAIGRRLSELVAATKV